MIEDIDTDMIYHNAFLHITEIDLMGRHAFGNLEGYQDFSSRAAAGDIIIAGRNFGAGSSRQQDVDCFLSLGISAILAPSYGAIYFRNAVNTGFPVLKSEELDDLVGRQKLENGDVIRIDPLEGQARNVTKDIPFTVQLMSSVQFDVARAGGLFRYGRTMGRP